MELLITQSGMINVDFAHVRQMMQMGGGSLLSIGYGEGNNKAQQAIERALHHPLLEAIQLEDATGIIANFTAGCDLTFQEVAEALSHLQEKTGNKADIIPGVINDPRMDNRVQVILIITGLGATPVDTQPKLVRVSETVEAPAVMDTSLHSSRPGAAQETAEKMSTERPQIEMMPSSVDLDLPAFMRRRVR